MAFESGASRHATAEYRAIGRGYQAGNSSADARIENQKPRNQQASLRLPRGILRGTEYDDRFFGFTTIVVSLE